MKGLMIALGKGMSDSDKEKDAKAEGPEREYAREAFSALKDDDEEGFIEAFLGAVRACKGKGASYESADDDEDEEV